MGVDDLGVDDLGVGDCGVDARRGASTQAAGVVARWRAASVIPTGEKNDTLVSSDHVMRGLDPTRVTHPEIRSAPGAGGQKVVMVPSTSVREQVSKA